MKIKRIISVLLALCMLAALTSCGDNTPTVMSLSGYEYTEAMYSYWASHYKGLYMDSYEDINDTESVWNAEYAKGKTYADFFDEMTLEYVKASLVNSVLFEKYRLSFTDKEKKSVDDYVSDLIIECAGGSKNDMNALLGNYGINTTILKNIYLEEEKSAKVYDYLYGENGTEKLTDEDFEAFYLENYVHVQMIYVENIRTYALDEEGNRLTDSSGYYVVEKLEGEKKEEKDAIVSAVREGIAKGEDFNSLYEKYSELKYANGQYFSAQTTYDDMFYYNLIAQVEKAKIGDVVTLESEMGTCIMKKLELDGGAWSRQENKDFFGDFEKSATDAAYQKLVEGYFDDIVVDEAIIKKYSVKEVLPAYI